MPFAVDAEFTITQVPETNQWILRKELVYFDSQYVYRPITVPEGFVCDGSSIPRFAWPLIGHPLEGEFGLCGFLHDLLYREKEFNRRACDLVYKEALIELGSPEWKAQTCYLTLRALGWWAWERKPKT